MRRLVVVLLLALVASTVAVAADVDPPEPVEPPRLGQLHNPHPSRVQFWYAHYRGQAALAFRRLVDWHQRGQRDADDHAKVEGMVRAIVEDPTDRPARLATLAAWCRAADRPAAKYAGAQVSATLLARAEDPKAETMARLSAILAAVELDRNDGKASARLLAIASDRTLYEDLRGAAIESASLTGPDDVTRAFALLADPETYDGCCRLRERTAKALIHALGAARYVLQLEARGKSADPIDRAIAAYGYKWVERTPAQGPLVALLRDRDVNVRKQAVRAAEWHLINARIRKTGPLDATFVRTVRGLAASDPDPTVRALALSATKHID